MVLSSWRFRALIRGNEGPASVQLLKWTLKPTLALNQNNDLTSKIVNMSEEIYACSLKRASVRSGADVGQEGLSQSCNLSQRCSMRFRSGLCRSFLTPDSLCADFNAAVRDQCGWTQSVWVSTDNIKHKKNLDISCFFFRQTKAACYQKEPELHECLSVTHEPSLFFL